MDRSMLLSTRLDQIIAIIGVFDGAMLGLTPPVPGIEQFWPFKHTRRPPRYGLHPPDAQ